MNLACATTGKTQLQEESNRFHCDTRKIPSARMYAHLVIVTPSPLLPYLAIAKLFLAHSVPRSPVSRSLAQPSFEVAVPELPAPRRWMTSKRFGRSATGLVNPAHMPSASRSTKCKLGKFGDVFPYPRRGLGSIRNIFGRHAQEQTSLFRMARTVSRAMFSFAIAMCFTPDRHKLRHSSICFGVSPWRAR